MYSRLSKYELVAQRTAGLTGTLVDVGARDKVLTRYLPAGALKYQSSDVVAGHDFQWDLERPIPAPAGAFDVVVALDVLEHVEAIHAALTELIRISRQKVFLSLPNMTALAFRLHFLRHGLLSDKYSLLPDHQGDRHRWLTSYPQVTHFVGTIAQQTGCQVAQYDLLTGYGRWQALAARLPLPAALRTYTQLFELTKAPA